MPLKMLTKRTRRIVGAAVAILITGAIGFGFVGLYINVKNEQIEGSGIIEVRILAEEPASPAILYEAVPTEQCIKQLAPAADPVAASAMDALPVAPAASQVAQALPAPSALSPPTHLPSDSTTKAAANVPAEEPLQMPVNAVNGAIKIIAPPPAALTPAGLPSCMAQSTVPAGIEKLGAQGFVALELNIAANGKVERGEIEVSSGFADLDAAALRQVTQTWRFEPCKSADKDVACKHRIRFRWAVQ